MKKILLLIVPVFLCIATHAQTATSITIVNNEKCSISVTQICYDATTCSTTATGNTVIVAPGGVNTLTIKDCSPDHAAYSVCWSGTVCATPACAVVNGGISATTSCYPNPATLPNCGTCASGTTGAKVSYNASTHVLTAD